MKQLYIITASGGSYDDSWERVEFVTDNQTKGNSYITQMNELRTSVINSKVAINKFMDNWENENISPKCRPSIVLPIPKWDSGIKVTEEMRKERKQLTEANEADRRDATKPYYDYCAKKYEARKSYIETFSTEIQKGIKDRYDDTYWSLDPIAWLD
ncbi:hypothetical protein GW796_08790 [archaeon]|nr:hypothetical protein [archaeon]NCQ51975.1 hypothetical protein [archaeon]